MHPTDADGMANSVDPDQTASSEAVWSWSALFDETYLSQYIEFIGYVHLQVQIYSFKSWLNREEKIVGFYCLSSPSKYCTSLVRRPDFLF